MSPQHLHLSVTTLNWAAPSPWHQLDVSLMPPRSLSSAAVSLPTASLLSSAVLANKKSNKQRSPYVSKNGNGADGWSEVEQRRNKEGHSTIVEPEPTGDVTGKRRCGGGEVLGVLR
ncbi:hypothetical protein AAFF_G00337330 [Aldrovandia affinis]|uniref:Uncharacterized protein n=1 Tax=Aldrovandia affinis TaxID=143900 RepID=A0AAD7SMY5_9TELE|nr:hypothetical protein AAFF_G00337330 [Aldrovandia affinis]